LITVKKINLKLVYPIRNLVLRIGKPIESCYFVNDERESTIHFGIIIDSKLVGVVSLFEDKNEFFTEIKQFQIRGMAILEEYQKKGYGNLLINESEKYCKNNNGNLIWFNARESAKPFYEKLSYFTFGTPFDIKDVGLHYIMYKKL
jgi:GNAT superfamily N-acetyltransferase